MRMNSRQASPSPLPVLCATEALAGCASKEVMADSLTTNTGRALGLENSAHQISDRVDSGVKATYNVRTTACKTHTCCVTGTVSVTGAVGSDAVCTEIDKPRAAAPQAVAPHLLHTE
jgi:hypothetical protein